MTAHAKLSASGAKKWINCPGSVLLEGQCPNESSGYATEGTNAHALCEAKIRFALKELTRYKYNKAVSGLETDPSMEDYADGYRDFVIERYNAAKAVCDDAVIELEKRLDFSAWVPEGFGTGDCIIAADGVLEIIDLKYGKGVKVDAESNPQLRLYALGAFSTYDYLYAIDKIRMTIYQPRMDNISSEEISVAELLTWGEGIKGIAQKAYAGCEEYHCGEHCDSAFCRARAICRAYADRQLEIARYDFAQPNKLSLEEIADIIDRAADLAKWAKLIADYALDRAVNFNEKFPGYKLVEGRSNRKWNASEEDITLKLLSKGCIEDSFRPRKLLTITAMEKYLGKKDFAAWCGEFVVKPPGAPTLVPESDKRPELNSIAKTKEDFDI